MFDTPLSDITFDQVVQFCQAFPEGVRVEYKQTPVHIPKIISSFANTVGGIWLIGVATDSATNMPRLPLTGMPRSPGVEEQIVQSAQTGIYPAITPAVRVLDVPDQPDRIIAIVKVPESSIEAPHAIENSTRVYVRIANTTPPYDLADIDRIEYLLKRRQEPERRREELITHAAARSSFNQEEPRIRVIIAPVYPRGLLIPPDTLYERASELSNRGGNNYMQFLAALRRRQGGIISTRTNYYFEVDIHGIVFFETSLRDVPQVPIGGRNLPYVHLINLLYHPAAVLNHVLPLLQGAMTNVLIRVELFGWNGIGFLPEFRPEDHVIDRGGTVEEYQCIDTHLAVSTNAILERLPERRVEVLTEIVQQALWAFNYTNPNLQDLVDLTLQRNRLNLTGDP